MPRRVIPVLRRKPSATITVDAKGDWHAWEELTFLIKCSERLGSTSRDVRVRRAS